MIQQAHNGADLLTDRQREIIRLQSLGLTMNEIARVLCIAPNTVNVHLQDAKRKLRIRRATSLTRFAIENGISPIGDVLTDTERRMLKGPIAESTK
jgi:DNA-binding NarL/FixJ family response regulator